MSPEFDYADAEQCAAGPIEDLSSIGCCGTLDPSGYPEVFYIGRASGRFTVVVYDETTRCFTVVRTFDSPVGAVHLTNLLCMGYALSRFTSQTGFTTPQGHVSPLSH